MYKLKEVLKAVVVAAGLFIFSACPVWAETKGDIENGTEAFDAGSEIDRIHSDEIDSILSDAGVDLSFKELVSSLYSGNQSSYSFSNLMSMAADVFAANRKALVQIIFLVVISAVINSFAPVFNKKQISDMASLIVSLSMITILTAVFFGAVNTAVHTLDTFINIYQAICTVFFPAVTYASGSATSAAYYQTIIMMITAADLFVKGVLIKLNEVYMLISLCDCVDSEEHFTKLCNVIKKGIRWSGKMILTIFIGMNGIKSILAPIGDSLKASYFFKAVGMIPGIGNSASTVSKSIIGAATMIKNSIGAAAIIVIVMCAMPVLKLVVLSFIYQAVAALMEPIGDKRTVKAVSVLSDAIGNLTYIITIVLVLFVITIAIICVATNINYT